MILDSYSYNRGFIEMAQYRYHFYLLNEENDNTSAIDILQFLEQPNNQLRGYYEDRDGEPGRSIFSNIGDALEQSEYVLVLISQHAIDSGWWKMKAHMALKHRLDNPERMNTVIPVYFAGMTREKRPLELQIIEGLDYDPNQGAHFWTQLRNIFS